MKQINPVKISSSRTPISYRESIKHEFRGYQSQKQRSLYQPVDAPVFNRVQQRLYDEALYGLKAYNYNEIAAMPKERQKQIVSRAKRVQYILNIWKQEVAHHFVDSFLLSLFPNSSIVKRITSVKGFDPHIRSFQTFKELGLDQLKIAEKLRKEGILPRNFFTLQPQPY